MDKILSPPESDQAGYLTVEEVCAVLHISRTTLWRWDAAGKLCSRRPGRRLLFPRDEVYALIESSR